MSITISSFLTQDHRNCDEVFAKLENSVAAEQWNDSEKIFEEFSKDLIHHFEMEESVMFPAFETKTGMQGGPTHVMRMEHSQMKQVLEYMQKDIIQKDKNHFFGLSETLMMLMQQHNMKEEQMLYKMADMHLGDEVGSIVEQMKSL